jgi:hypothetical protein
VGEAVGPRAGVYCMMIEFARLLLVVVALLGAVVGGAAPARAQTFTEFSVPTPNADLNGIVTGPDGALWFTEFWANKIGRLAPAANAPTNWTVASVGDFNGDILWRNTCGALAEWLASGASFTGVGLGSIP